MDETTHTTPPPSSPPPPAPPAERVLRRRDGHLGGVAGGVAHYLDLDATLVRVVFVLLALVGGSGVFLYLAGWLLIPTEQQDPSPRPVALRTGSVPAVVGAVILALAAWAVLGPFGGDGGLLGPLLLLGLGVWLLSQRPSPGPPTPAAGADHPAGSGWDEGRSLAPALRQASGPVPPPPPTGGSVPGYAVPHGPDEPVTRRPEGPPITSITLAVLAVAVGVLLVLETVGAIELTAVAVAATALVVIGGGLLASAFLGRALGLIPLGLVATVALAVAPAADLAIDGGIADREVRVADGSDLDGEYRLGIGSLVLDLTGLDPAELDRELEVGVGIGYAEVLVPEGVRVEVEGRAALGYVRILDRQRDGTGVSLDVVDGPAGGDVLVLDADVRIGALEVRRG